jgi:hypothetical protein
MKRWVTYPLVVLSAAMLAACGGGGGGAGSANLRVLHASPDAPAVDVLVRGTRIVSNAKYKDASGYSSVDAGDTEIKVNAAGTQTTVLSATPSLGRDKSYTLIAANKLAVIEPLLIEDEASAIPAGSARLRVVHAAPSAPAVDVYVTAPGTAIASATPTLTNVAFKAYSSALPVPAGDYRIRVTATGSRTPVYDSGKIALAAGQDLLAVAVDQKEGLAPISLIALPASGASLEIVDNRAQVRVGHLSPDAPAVDILVNNVVTLSGVPYPVVSSYLTLDAGTYNLKVNAAGTATTVINADVPFKGSKAYSVFATGFLAGIAPLVVEDALALPPSGQSKLRVIHASPDAPNVDVLVNGNRVLANVPFRAASDYLTLPAGTYQVQVRVAGTTTVVLAASLTVEPGKIYSALAIGSAAGGTNPLQLKVVIDR